MTRPMGFNELRQSIRVFAIVSWGSAATTWLARVLNSHPDMLVVHQANVLWSREGGHPPLTEIRYLEFLQKTGFGHSVVGDVHGIARHAIPRISEFFGSRFAAAVVVREPCARLSSQLALFDELRYTRWPGLDYIDQVAERCGIAPGDLTARDRCYLHGMNMLNAITEEQEIGPVHRMEDLTTSARALRDLVADISGHTLSSSRSWSRSALRAPSTNPHATDTRVTDLARVEVQGHPLPRLLRTIVSPEAWSAYEALGYREARQFLEV